MRYDLNELRDRLARYESCRDIPTPTEPSRLIGPESVGARGVAARRGRFWHRSTAYQLQDPWGETIVERLLDRALPTDQHGALRVPFHDPQSRVPLSSCVFVDCETTGLSGGVGTIAFLIALGRYDGEAFVVDQYFLPDLADEGAILDCVAEQLDHAAAVVTYNGRAFDLPLLEGRFRFWRLEPAFRELPDLDLLWPTRALFSHRLPSCALSQVEEQLLKFARVEDLPGAEVPQVYFQYLHEGFSPRLHAVFEHNWCDVVSLFVYSLWLDQETLPERPTLAAPDDLAALARLWFRHRQPAAALAALDEDERRVLDQGQRAHLHELRGRILKRERAYDAAHTQWEKVARIGPLRHDAAVEMAKHLEHRRHDYAAAMAVVDQALDILRFREASGENVDGARTELLKRRLRLRRRLRCV